MTFENIKNMADMTIYAAENYNNEPFVKYLENDKIIEKSFQTFYCDSAAFSHYLIAEQKKGKHIALIGKLSYYWMISFMGIVNADCVAIPLDVKYTLRELTDVLVRGDVDILIYQENMKEIVIKAIEQSGRNIELLCVENDIPKKLEEYDRTLTTDIDENKCAMILFTSGTTGKSKGVMLSHKNVIDNLSAVVIQSGWNKETSSWLSILPNHHIYCLSIDFLFGVLTGIPVAINSSMEKMFEEAKRFKVKGMTVVPLIVQFIFANLEMLANKNPTLTKEQVKNLLLGESFYRLGCAGAFLEPVLRSSIEEYGICLTQGYGMTECTSHISCDSFSGPRDGSVGKKLDALDMKLVDNEIWVKGAGVMLGYYNDVEQTKAILEDGWLKTGDLGYMDDEGWIYITGRKKNLIILASGENVSPEEIELLLQKHQIVKEVLVYEKNNLIEAEIFPNEVYLQLHNITDVKHEMEKVVQTVNKELASYKKICRFQLRDCEFSKNNSQKIKRFMYHNK
ncbi:MAG: acyl--CoA ligase [Lachnospiraceae bacterium]|nr:acyl--CoA ligase [Lachnospiraceae bacterium]